MSTTSSVLSAADAEARRKIEKALDAPRKIAEALKATADKWADEQRAAIDTFASADKIEGAQATSQWKAREEKQKAFEEQTSALKAWDAVIKELLKRLRDEGSSMFTELLKAKIDELQKKIGEHDAAEADLEKLKGQYEAWLPPPAPPAKPKSTA